MPALDRRKFAEGDLCHLGIGQAYAEREVGHGEAFADQVAAAAQMFVQDAAN